MSYPLSRNKNNYSFHQTDFIPYKIKETKMAEQTCETCPMRLKAEKNPKSLMARLWKWHTTWCPGWKAYQKSLEAKANQA